jgi:glycosyltransferase involved in cell wall biosynthesis
MAADIYFWQRIATPHMLYLAEAMASLGFKVTYVANSHLSAHRKAMGWEVPEVKGMKLVVAEDKSSVVEVANSAKCGSIHLTQGVRGNKLVGVAQRELERRGMAQWIIMETVDDRGFLGFLRRLVYRIALARCKERVRGILAIGLKTRGWIVDRGFPANRIFPFAYFLHENISTIVGVGSCRQEFEFMFVGQLVKRKGVDILVRSLALCSDDKFFLTVLGDGPERRHLEQLAEQLIPGRVRWLGSKKMQAIPQQIADVDCLVLPSLHDGWGAVVSEALMVGTEVICSDGAGSCGVVVATAGGQRVPAGDIPSLTKALSSVMHRGKMTDEKRRKLKDRSVRLGAKAGASYLSAILDPRLRGKDFKSDFNFFSSEGT